MLIFNIASGQKNYFLGDPSIVHRLDTHVKVFIDSTDGIPFQRISERDFQTRLKPSKGNLTFGYLESTIWLKLETRTGSPHTRWLLEIPAPYLEYVDFFQLDSGNRWQRSSSGYYRKHSERDISHTGHLLPLQFQKDSVSVVYIRIAGLSPKTFPLYVIEEGAFNQKTRFEDLWYGIFFGVLIVMFFYNLFIYIILRQRNYLFYFCTIVCTFLIFAAISGYGGKFLWPELPIFNYYTGKLALEVLIIFLTVFTILFLEVRKYSMAMYYLLVSLFPLAGIAFVLVITKMFPFAGNTLVFLSTIVFMTAGIVVRIKGNKTADYFIAAWTIYFAGGILITFRNSGVFDYNFWTTHFVEIGAVLETTIIGFALGHRYRRFKREKEEAQIHALKIQEEAMGWLEAKVKERPEELSKAYDQLRRTLKTSEMQTLLIQQKNFDLDSFFYRISHDLKGPISSALGLTILGKLETKDGHALDLFERLQIQLERMSNIFNGLIKLAQFDAGLQTERIDFDKMIDDCIMSFHSLPNFSKITFKKEVPPGLLLYSEWTLLNGILQNLIENSIKYARGENPFVHISVRDDSGWIVFKVEDNGQGIPPEHLPRIFELFYRGTENETGTGIGLYLLKRAVDRLNGNVEVKSGEGKGSTFIVRLPSSKEIAREDIDAPRNLMG
ncbi:MAG: sensor histidine kinase [Cyclobacteriaceae bacterium]